MFSSQPYGKYIAQAGTAHSASASQPQSSVYLHSRVKVLAIFSSTRRLYSSCHGSAKRKFRSLENQVTSSALRIPSCSSTFEINSSGNDGHKKSVTGSHEEGNGTRDRSTTHSVSNPSECSNCCQYEFSSTVSGMSETPLCTLGTTHAVGTGEKRLRESNDELYNDNGNDYGGNHSSKYKRKDENHKNSALAHVFDNQQRHIYIRLQYDKSCIETLPLELMRERHPQVLIDYLLSNSLWS